MIRCRFKQPMDDPRPITWPIMHPYWVSGEGIDEGGEYHIIVAYADSEEEIVSLWPEATNLDSEEATEYCFTSRFPKPDWLEGGASQ